MRISGTYQDLRIILIRLLLTESGDRNESAARSLSVSSGDSTHPEDTLQTFKSPNGVFQFKYPSVLVRCTQSQRQEGWWIPDDDCNSQGEVCDERGSSALTIGCFAYPKDEFKDKPEFSAAAFFVAEVRTAATGERCLKGSQYWLVEKTEDTTIHSVRMKRFTIGSAWTGGRLIGQIYRVFRGGACYEFGFRWASSDPSNIDPYTIKINQFTKQDADKVSSALKQPVDSFIFLK
jgi:hypothetical protein